LIENGDLIQVAPEVVFSRAGYEGMVSDIRQLLAVQGTLTAAQVRDHFNTSRKYALALLEYLDTLGITVREGDARRLK
jgi:selenocysteine-specific elongation factor